MQGNIPLSINLGKKKDDSIGNVFFKWAITSGKIIIVGVELLALGALGFRFFIDSQIVDLHDKIVIEQIFIKSLTAKEEQFRSIQNRLTTIQTLTKETQGKITFLQSLLTLLQGSNFTSSNLSVTDNTIVIDGQIASIFALNSFIDVLKGNPQVESISVDELNSANLGIRFKLTVDLKGEKKI